MRFWDSSAIVPLCIAERSTEAIQGLFREDRDMAAWWGSVVECESALARRLRDGTVSEHINRRATKQLRDLEAAWYTMDPTETIRDRAIRLLRVHVLAAADALQLSAAVAWCEDQPRGHEFVSLDTRLAHAAHREGFLVLPLELGAPRP